MTANAQYVAWLGVRDLIGQKKGREKEKKLPGVLLAIEYYKKENLNQKKLVIVSLINLFLIAETVPRMQYFIPLMPYVCILAAYSIYKFSKNKNFLLVIILVLICSYSTFKLIEKSIKYNIRNNIKRIKYVMDNTNKNDLVYDY